MNIDVAVQGLVEIFGLSRETAYRTLKRGNGHYFDIYSQKGRARIKIYALKRVCEGLAIQGLTDRHFRDIPASQFKGSARARAELYASIHKPEGIKGKPVSRESLENRTGLHKVQQIRYEKEAGIKRTYNAAMYQGNDPLGGNGYKPLKQEIYSNKKGHREINKRLPNSYHTRQQASSIGMLGKVSRKLAETSLIPKEAPRLSKRYFPSFRRLCKALMRRCQNDKEGYYLVDPCNRVIPGRLEWCLTSI